MKITGDRYIGMGMLGDDMDNCFFQVIKEVDRIINRVRWVVDCADKECIVFAGNFNPQYFKVVQADDGREIVPRTTIEFFICINSHSSTSPAKSVFTKQFITWNV